MQLITIISKNVGIINLEKEKKEKEKIIFSLKTFFLH